MIEIRTLGAARVEIDGREIARLSAHRQKFALLAYLSLEGPVSRDRLLAVFWPEREEERARHSLSQALYSLRRELGEDCVNVTGEQVGLQEMRVQSDARRLQTAADRGDWETVVDLYDGAFLDGFHLPGAPGFEEWQSATTARVSRLARRAFSEIIGRRSRAGAIREALTAAERWADLEPLEDEAQHAAIELLAATGNRSAAIQRYEAYRERLSQEMGVEPLERTVGLVERIRAGATPVSSPGTALRGRTTTSPPGSAAQPRPRSAADRRRARRIGRYAAGVVLLLLAAALTSRVLMSRRTPSTAPTVTVAVLPFVLPEAYRQNRVAVTQLERRLTSAMEWLNGIRTIDGSRLVGDALDWHSIEFSELQSRARAMGGAYLVAPEIVGTGSDSRLTLNVYAVADGARLYRGGGPAGPDSAVSTLERLAFEGVRAIADREGLSLTVPDKLLAGTPSPMAFTNLIQGQSYFWAQDFSAAAAAFAHSIEADSDFAVAYYRLSVADNWLHDDGDALGAIRAALARRDHLAAPAVQLLAAQREFLLGHAHDAISGFQQSVVDIPDNTDGWLGLAESLLHLGGFAGYRPVDARPAFDRVGQLDSTFAPIYTHLVDLAIHAGDAGAARRYLRRMRSDDLNRPSRALAVDLRFGDDRARAAALNDLRRADRFTLSRLVTVLGHGALDLPLVDTIGRALMGPDRTPDDRLRGAQYRFLALTGLGRWDDAVSAWSPVAEGASFDRWYLAADLAGYDGGVRAERMYDWARSLVARGEAPDFSLPAWNERRQAFRALAHRALLRGDSSEVLALLGPLSQAESPNPADVMPEALRHTLQARLALLAADTTQAIEQLEDALARVPDLSLISFYPLFGLQPERFLLARLLVDRGEPARARTWIESFGNTWMSLGDVMYSGRLEELASPPSIVRGPSH